MQKGKKINSKKTILQAIEKLNNVLSTLDKMDADVKNADVEYWNRNDIKEQMDDAIVSLLAAKSEIFGSDCETPSFKSLKNRIKQIWNEKDGISSDQEEKEVSISTIIQNIVLIMLLPVIFSVLLIIIIFSVIGDIITFVFNGGKKLLSKK